MKKLADEMKTRGIKTVLLMGISNVINVVDTMNYSQVSLEEDYDVCFCGGKLKYIKPRVFYDDDSVLESYYLMLRKFFIFVGILAVIALIPIIIWYIRI